MNRIDRFRKIQNIVVSFFTGKQCFNYSYLILFLFFSEGDHDSGVDESTQAKVHIKTYFLVVIDRFLRRQEATHQEYKQTRATLNILINQFGNFFC